MKANVSIRNVAVYHPENIIGNDYYIKHFDEQGKDIRNLLIKMGREDRYLSFDKDENALTMGIISAKRALEQAELTGKDIDLIAFCSGTPEFVCPSNALKIHQVIDGNESAIVYDLNSNCSGMLLAFEQICRNMQNNPSIKYAMIIGSEQFNKYADKNDEIVYPNFADASCAVILERIDQTPNGFVDSNYYIDSSLHDNVLLPKCGMSKVHDDAATDVDKGMCWVKFDAAKIIEKASESIELLLEKHDIPKSEVKQYFLSQLSKGNMDLIRENLTEPEEKCMYIGNEFGYTGTNSIFIALSIAIEQNKISRGDTIVFWAMSAGWSICSVLFKY